MTADKFVVEFSGKSWRVFQFGEHIFSQSSFLGAQGSPLLEQVNHIIILLMEKMIKRCNDKVVETESWATDHMSLLLPSRVHSIKNH